MKLAEELRNSQEKDFGELKKILFDLIKEDIKSRAQKGHTTLYADLDIYIRKMDQKYTLVDESSGEKELLFTDSPETAIWYKFRELFFVFSSGGMLKIYLPEYPDAFGAQPQILNKISNSLITDFKNEGFDVAVKKELCAIISSSDIPWSYDNNSEPMTLKISISW